MNYSKLVEVYIALEKTSKRLEKTYIISKFLKKVPKSDIGEVIYLLQGRVFAPWDERKLGMSSRLLVKVIAQASGNSTDKIESLWSKKGDLGLVAEELMENKRQKTLFSTKLTIKKIITNISKLAEMEGEGTVNRKVGLISELLSSADKVESKFIIRTVLEELRTGVGDGTIRDAIVWAFYPEVVKNLFDLEDGIKQIKGDVTKEREEYNKISEKVQHAFDVTTDFGLIAEKLKENISLDELSLTVGRPIKVMLYKKAKDFEDAFETVGTPAIIEPKIDGFRMQIHRNKEEIKLFTRRLEDVTKQFPDVVKVVGSNVRSKDFILDTEILGIDKKTKRAIPFQNISQRIKRKHDIEKMAKILPVVINVFDIIELNGENLLQFEFEDRRKKLKAIIKEDKFKIELIEQLITSDIKKAEKYYQECLAKGHEGVMVKNKKGIYKPGSRVGYGMKIKPVMESLDLVILKAEWGEGKRAKWLSSFTLACRDKDQLLEIGKVGTGIKEKSEEGVSFEELTEELKPLVLEEKGKTVTVKPKIIVEVNYEEIQKSTNYSSGYALRFPRVIRLRLDKGIRDISTLNEVSHFYREQK
ncbi:ATP-dependent DNA ligase [archaeon]|jgi:DNA ligase 1|nr:ATP-dependent DNA ligase [archaeon]MBT4396926.1 ATP-dependent DNA ligase [archaeon]MBT4440917.1 ATP-dependent DNA ligase [archaeon]